MCAIVIFSLGGTNPGPPRTCRGTMVNAAVAALPARMNLRREKAADPLDVEGPDPALDALELVAGRDGDFAVWVRPGAEPA